MAIIASSSPAQVAKLVDAGDSKSPAARCVGSSPTLGTKFSKRLLFWQPFFIAFRNRPPFRQWGTFENSGGLCLSSAAGCRTCRLKTEDWLKDSAECRKENCSENSDMRRNCRWLRRLRPSCWPVPDATLPSSNPKNRRIGPKVGKTGRTGDGFLPLRVKTTV